jgi:hypothetical protein
MTSTPVSDRHSVWLEAPNPDNRLRFLLRSANILAVALVAGSGASGLRRVCRP